MKLEVGKKYKSRRGDIVTITTRTRDCGIDYPFSDNEENSYTESGNFYSYMRSEEDLIEEVAQEKQSPNYKGGLFNNGKFVSKGTKVKFLDQIGEVIGINDGHVVVSFSEQSMLFGDNMRLLGFENENTLEIVKEEYQVLYKNKFGKFNVTSSTVDSINQASCLINGGQLFVGLIDKNGNIIKE